MQRRAPAHGTLPRIKHTNPGIEAMDHYNLLVLPAVQMRRQPEVRCGLEVLPYLRPSGPAVVPSRAQPRLAAMVACSCISVEESTVKELTADRTLPSRPKQKRRERKRERNRKSYARSSSVMAASAYF